MSALPEISGYACERVLGEGAYGTVWLARETQGLRRPVALKLFSPERLAAFERELELVRRIEEVRRQSGAASLVQALGSGREGERGWIALEWLEGGSLDEAVGREGPFSPERAHAVAREVGGALALLHGAGLFHRDVKPQNVLLGADGRARLGDFGLSRELQGSLSAAGSPAFAAPEVIAGRPVDGRAADLYSLGATLAWLLTGETILPGRPDAFALERRGVPRPFTLALMRACALDPGERTKDINAFLGELEEFPRTSSGGRDGGGVGGAAIPPRNPPETPVTKTEALIQDVEDHHTRKPARTARSAILSLVTALLVLPLMMVTAAVVAFAGQSKAMDEAFYEEQRQLARDSAGLNDREAAEQVRQARLARESASARRKLLVLVFNVGVPLLLELTAIVSGILALSWIARSAGALAGRMLAISGLVIAGANLCAVLAVVALVLRTS